MTTSIRHLIGLGLGAAVALMACNPEPAGGPASRSESRSRLSESEWYLYFRCNATSWNTDEASRLRPSPTDPNVLSLVYTVSQPWMTTSGDNCVFTETNRHDDFGTWQLDWSRQQAGTVLDVPGSDAVDGVSDGMVPGASYTMLRYPAPGKYRVTVYWAKGRFTVTMLSPPEAWEPAPGMGLSAIGLSTVVNQGGRPGGWVGITYVGYADGDVYLSTDARPAHPTWTRLNEWTDSSGMKRSLPRSAVVAIAVDPYDYREAFVAFAGGKTGPQLWVTRDAATWTQVSGLPLPEVWGVSYDPFNPRKLWVVGPGGAVAETADGGETWSADPLPDELRSTLPPDARITTVASIPMLENGVWVGTTDGRIFGASGPDATRTFTELSSLAMPGRPVTRLTPSPMQLPPEVYATYVGLSGDAVWATRDGGQTWLDLHRPDLPVSAIPVAVEAMLGVSVNPVYDDVLYAIDSHSGVARSTDRGLTWVRAR